MKVIDILEIANIHIVENNKVVSSYNGKDNIDKKYNNMEVRKIDAMLFDILIYV